MSCNNPMLAIPHGFTKEGKVHYKMLGRYDQSLREQYKGAIPIPCGQCAGCRANKCRAWADRMVLELDHDGRAVFLTLTYDDDHIPQFLDTSTGELMQTLNKRDFQLFMKRLRKQKIFADRELRYYACGEYGSNTHRPHLHLILYGVSLNDFNDLEYRGNNELGQQYYSSPWLAKHVWKNGFCLIANVSWNSCAYVARYVKKKDFGYVPNDSIERLIEPEFSVMSRNPGIGFYYPREHPDFANYSKYFLTGNEGSIEVRFPKDFLRFLEKTDPDFYEQLKDQRRKYADDRQMAILSQTDLSSMELDMIEESKIKKTKDIIDRYRTVI